MCVWCYFFLAYSASASVLCQFARLFFLLYREKEHAIRITFYIVNVQRLFSINGFSICHEFFYSSLHCSIPIEWVREWANKILRSRQPHHDSFACCPDSMHKLCIIESNKRTDRIQAPSREHVDVSANKWMNYSTSENAFVRTVICLNLILPHQARANGASHSNWFIIVCSVDVCFDWNDRIEYAHHRSENWEHSICVAILAIDHYWCWWEGKKTSALAVMIENKIAFD